ncbi:MAG: FtsX-like permease family protein [Verrucomicrobia bacterium]|nr:MAG: FtsX-like permease family protein [Verrucomicrobiota bacterium]
MSASLFLARRYLQPKRTFLSVITLISVLGVTLGITVLILVISVMTGFQRELQRKVIGFDAHLVISQERILDHWQQLSKKVEHLPEVEQLAPFVQGPVIVEFQHRRLTPNMRGIDPEKETELQKFIKEGSFDLNGDNAIVGSEMASTLGLQVGDKITIFSSHNLNQILEELNKIQEKQGKANLDSLRQLVLPTELTVTGIFETGRYFYDSEFVLVPLHIGQELYGLGDCVHGLALWVKNADRADVVQKNIRSEFTKDLIVTTWMDSNKQLFDAIAMERHVMFFLLMFIVLVAAFGIMNTLITVTVQKTREIGILQALGARTGQIIMIFLVQGMIVGVVGVASGLALGMTLIRWRNEVSQALSSLLGVEIFSRTIYQFSEIPAEVVPSDVAVICLSAFAICSLAALVPAWLASRLDPVKALRYE